MRKVAAGIGCMGTLFCSVTGAQTTIGNSSVTIYGNVDAGLSVAWGGNAKTLVSEDQYHTSRIGLRGSESLGDGLATIFKIEARYQTKNGAQQDSQVLFNDETYAGLKSTDYGTIKVGRVYSPFYLALAGRIDPFNGDGIGSMTGFTSIGHNLSPGNLYDSAKGYPNLDVRTSNAVDYASPVISGFTFQYQTSFPDNRAAREQSIAVKYDGPTFFSETGYERQAYQQHAFDWHIGGGMNYGPFKLTAGYTQGYFNDDEFLRGNKTRSELLGMTYRPASEYAILAAVANMHSDKATLIDTAKGTQSSAIKFALGYEYYLSTRTKLYAHYAHVTKPLAYIFVSNTSKAMVGIDHKF